MQSQLNSLLSNGGDNRKAASIRFVKGVFAYMFVYEYNIKNAFGYIRNNYPSKTINAINIYLTYTSDFLDGSKGISKTIGELTNVKNLFSQSSAHINNDRTRIRGYLIRPLSELKKYESHISRINEISSKYDTIKHKVRYCESSLEFELERLESISSTSKMIQKQLESLIEILTKYKTNLEKLKQFKQKLETLKDDKKKKIAHLKNITNLAIFYLNKIKCISQDLSSRKECVSILTIKNDIEYIKGELGAVQNIVASVQSTLLSLRDVKFEVDCGTLNEIEGCIKEIVCLIHKKYCCLSSITSKINIEELCKTESLAENCKLPEIQPCASSQPGAQGSDSCQSCETSSENQQCQCCLQICKCLDELKSKANSCEKNITQNLNWIKSLTTTLSSNQPGQTTSTCSAVTTGQGTCQTPPRSTCPTSEQAGTNPGCTSQAGDVKRVIQCIIDEIKILEDNVKAGMIRV